MRNEVKHIAPIYNFFSSYIKGLLRRSFHQIIYQNEVEKKNMPTLIIANHTSWWDGFWIFHLIDNYLHQKFHFLMLEEQINKNWQFKYTGGISLRKGSKDTVKTLQFCTEILKNRENALLIFPQGKIESMHIEKIHFAKGIDFIIKKIQNEVNILFVANFIEYQSNKKPSLFVYTKSILATNMTESAEKIYNDFYLQSKNNLISQKHD